MIGLNETSVLSTLSFASTTGSGIYPDPQGLKPAGSYATSPNFYTAN